MLLDRSAVNVRLRHTRTSPEIRNAHERFAKATVAQTRAYGTRPSAGGLLDSKESNQIRGKKISIQMALDASGEVGKSRLREARLWNDREE
jgi:hypothetical protein